MDLSVVMPTRDRRAIASETLRRLEQQTGDVTFEVIVVNDGSVDRTSEAIARFQERSSVPVTVIEEEGRGVAAARNRGLTEARSPVCLFIDDDTWPRPDLVVRHRDFHRRRPEQEAALLGRVDIAEWPPPTPFMRWFLGLHLGYEGIDDATHAGGRHFFTGNVSVKTELLRRSGGFDEAFGGVAHDDIDLGLRLEQLGMRLAWDRDAVAEHYQPTDLEKSLDRMHRAGRSL